MYLFFFGVYHILVSLMHTIYQFIKLIYCNIILSLLYYRPKLIIIYTFRKIILKIVLYLILYLFN